MSEAKHTPGPWPIRWYECLADRDDVEAKSAKKVGEVLWRVPKEIGPLSPDHNPWARAHLDVSEADARLIAAAPELLEALKLAQQLLIKKCNQTLVTFTGADVDALTAIDEAIAKATGKTK